MVTEALGRPVAVDTHPKHSVALGAARVGQAVRTEAAVPAPPPSAVHAAAVLDPGSSSADPDHTMVVDTDRTPVAGEATGVLSPSSAAGSWDDVRDAPTEPALAPIGGEDRSRPAPRGRGRWIAAGLVVLLVIGGLAVANLSGSGTDEPGFAVDPVDDPTDEAEEEPAEGADPVADAVEEDSADGVGGESEEPSEEPEEAEEPAVPEEPVAPTVPPAACDGGSCITIDDVTLDGGELLITWTADGFVPDTSATHAHFYWGIYDAAQVGTNAADRSPWELTDAQPFVPGGELQLANRPAGADTVCVTAADGEHAVIEPANHHCVPLPVDA